MPKLCRLSLVLGSTSWLFAAAGAHAVRPSPLPQCSTSCTQNSPCEINLSTTNAILTEATLFSVRVRANVTFTGTGTAETRNVPGFYFDRTSYGSGLATFKLRFTPTQVGTYHYETFSAYGGLGGQVGDFTCSAAVPLPGGGGTNRGFLRRDPNSAYSYSWDDGTRFLLWGQTYYQIVNQARRNTDSDATWKAAVDNSRSSGMNKVRLLVSPWTEDPFKDSMGSRAAETQPYCTGASSSACEVAAGALDFTRVNLDHFVALDEVVHYLFGKGTIAEIIIFRDPGPYGAMVSGNMDQNKQYLRYVTARYAAYPNVTWSLSNEWQNADPTKANWDALGSCVRSGCTDSAGRTVEADPWILDLGGTKRRPLTVHPNAVNGQGKCFAFIGSTWPNNGSLQYGNGPKTSAAGYDSIACNRRTDVGSCPGGNTNRNIPYVNDEYGYIGNVNQRQHRNLIWGILTGGGFGAAGDARAVSTGCPAGFVTPCEPPILSTIWSTAAQYTDTQRMLNFVSSKSVPYWSMSPQQACPETDQIHTLGNTTTRKFLVYFSQEGTSPASQVPAGNYTAAWYDPRNNTNFTVVCAAYGTGAVTAPPAGAPACSAAPCDWLVYLQGC